MDGYCSQLGEGPVALAWLWCPVPTQTPPYTWAALSRSHHLSELLLRCSHRTLEARACACLSWVPAGSCSTFESRLQVMYVLADLAPGPCCALSWAPLVAQLVKNPPAMRVDLGSIPGLGRSPGEEKGYPLQYSSLENSMVSPWGHKESDSTERLSLSRTGSAES